MAVTSGVGLDQAEPREARTESARTTVLFFISLVHISCKKMPLNLGFYPPRRRKTTGLVEF